jgi:hypothetical protein
LAFGPPSNFGKDDPNKSVASLTFTVSVKDSTGTVRPDRTFVQTLTRAKDGSDSKLIRIDGTSTVFAFADDWDWTAEPSEITFNLSSQNLAAGEEVTVDDIKFFDKDGNDVSAAVKDYINPPDSNGDEKTNEQLIIASLQTGDSFSLRFAQFQGLAKDEDGNSVPAGVYQDQNGETIENSSYTLQQLKNTGFPLTVKVTKTGLAGAVQTISDETRVLSLLGGTNAIQIDAPNANHLFDADADMVVNPNTLGDAGTDIDVYVGAAPLSYDNSGDTELQRNKYRFKNFQYGGKTGSGTADNMLTLAVRSDKTGIDVTTVSHDYTMQKVTLPIEIRRTDGELFTRNLLLTYSKVKEGRDGENLKDRNFDFSQGPTGWSLDDTSTKGSDLTSVQLAVDSDEKANFGGSVGVFHFVDTAAATTPPTANNMMDAAGKSKSIYISEALPVGATAEPGSNVDDGTWLIKFRAKVENHPDLDAGSSLKATNQFGSPIRAWLSIKPFSGDGTPYSPVPAVDNTSPLFYFDVPNTTWASAAIVHGKLGFSTNDDAGYDYDDYSVPLLKDHYLTYVLRVSPAEIQSLMGTAASFKIAMRFKGTALGTDKSPLIKVDAFQAEKLPYSSLLGFDEEQWDNLQNSLSRLGDVETSRAEEAAEGDELQDLGVLEDMSSLTNYNLANKYSNNFPASVIPAVWSSDGSEEFSYSDDNLPMGSPVTIMGITAAEDSYIIDGGRAIKLCHVTGKRHSVTFPMMAVPAPNYKICLKIRYKTDSTSTLVNNDWSTESATNGPLVRLYFSEDYAEGKKYIITQDTNYNYAGSDDVTHRRVDDNDDGENIVCSMPLDYAPTWRTQEKIITLDTAGIGSSYNNLKSGKELKYFSISLFPGSDSGASTSRDRDLSVDYIDVELLPPVTMADYVGGIKGARAEQWFSTDPATERAGAVNDTKNDPTISPWVATTPTGERAAAKSDTFNDTRFTVAESNASDGKAGYDAVAGMSLQDDGDGIKLVIPGNAFTDLTFGGVKNSAVDKDSIGMGGYPDGPDDIVDQTFGDNRYATTDGNATDGKTAHTGLANGNFTEEDGFLKFDLGTMGTKTSPHPTDIRKTGKNNFIATGGITIVGTTAEKTGGNSGWGSDQISSKDGYIGGAYASAVYAGGSLMFGLNTDPLANSTWSSIDYAWYINGGTAETIYESGSSKGNHNVTSGDVLSVTYDGHSIRYLINGEVARTVEVSITSKLFFDSAFSNIGAKIENIDFGPMSDTSKGHEVRGFFGDEAAPLIKVTNAPTDLKNANAFDSGTPGAQVKVRADSGAGANSMIDGATFDVNADGTMTLNFGADTINNIGVGSTPTLNPTTKVSNGAISISNGTISGIGTGAGTKVSNSLVYSDMNALDTSHMNFDFDTADTWRMWQDSWTNSYADVGTDTAFTVADSGEALYGNKVATLAVGKQDHVRRWYSEEFVFPTDTSILSKSTFTFNLRAKGPGTSLFRWFITLFSEGRNGANSLYFDFATTVAEEDGINSNNGSLHSGPQDFTMKSGKWCTFIIDVPFSRMISEYSSAKGFRIGFEKNHSTVNNTVVDHCGFTISNPAARGPSTKGLFGAVGLTTGKVNADIGNIGVSINSSGKISLKKDGSGDGDVTVDKSKVGLSKVPNYNIDQVRDSVGSYLGSSNGFLSGIAGNLNISNGSLAVASSLDSVSLGAELGLGGGWVPPNIPGMNFTGKHPCLLAGEIPDTEICGFIVSSTGVYQNQTEELSENTPTIDEALPVVKLSDEEKEKACFGVISKHLEEGKYEINSVGEGAMWVANTAGDLENGDYICSSNIPGYGMKQDDDILRNYTVAKITQDCLFDLDSEDYDCKEVEHDGIIYKVAFVGCTYHCG